MPDADSDVTDLKYKILSKKHDTDFLRSHKRSIKNAEKAKEYYYGSKIKQSLINNQKSKIINEKLKRLESSLIDRHNQFLNTKNDISTIISKLEGEMTNMQQASKDNYDCVQDIKGRVKLTQNEIIDLYKKIDNEKSKLSSYYDQLDMFKKRQNTLNSHLGDDNRRLHINKDREGAYKKLIDEAENDLNTVQEKIKQLNDKIRDEEEKQNKLEIEQNKIENRENLNLFLNSFD
ncbi:hypothetical protein NUSPORA_00588 [Nucleospora cyclopteri]